MRPFANVVGLLTGVLLASGHVLMVVKKAFTLTEPTIWIDPQPPYSGKIGEPDFLQLFRDPAQWHQTAARIGIFSISEQFLFTVEKTELNAIVRTLQAQHIRLAVGALAQNAYDEPPCGNGVEGYSGPNLPKQVISKLRAAGAEVDYVEMDEPLWFGHFYSGHDACHSSIDNVAQRAAEIVSYYRDAFPAASFVDVEPIPSLTSQSDWQNAYTAWRSAFRHHVARDISTIKYDVDWGETTAAQITAIQRAIVYCRRAALSYGFIYNGADASTSNAAWIASAKQHIALIEHLNGDRPPPHISFQSWVNYPDHALPEKDALSFTGWVLCYLNWRHP